MNPNNSTTDNQSIKATQSQSQNPAPINTSTMETQRQLRIAKIAKIQELGYSAFPVTSRRDKELLIIKFWFDFVHKFDFSQIETDTENYYLESLLENLFFPPTLLEAVEEKIKFRSTAKEMGLDPDDIDTIQDEKSDQELIQKIKSYLPDFSKYKRETREYLLKGFFDTILDESGEEDSLEISFAKHQKITLAGRIKSKRVAGKIAFAQLEDESCPEGFQLILKKDILDKTLHQKFLEAFDPKKIDELMEKLST
jgi:lysyl-tRNA synthetase class II